MKGIKTFQQLVRVLHKNGKLNDVVSHGLIITASRLQHDLHVKDRRSADKHFTALCDLLSDVLDR